MSASQVPPELLPYLLGEKKDNSSLQDSILRISISFAALVVFTTALRFWVRFRMLRAVGLDDVLMILALLFALLLSASCLIGSHYGLGKHLWNLSPDIYKIPEHTARVTKALYGCYLSYALAIAFVKFSIIATYFRIFADGLLRRTIAGVGFIVLGLLLCNIFAIIFTCVPVEAAWKYEIKGKCFPIIRFFYASSAINIATDLALCFLPIPTLWSLSMPRSQRVVLCILFTLGAFTCVASILRLRTLQTAKLGTVDISYSTVSSLNWCVIEVGTAIMCASLSSLRPLAARVLPKLFSHLTNHSMSTHQRTATKLSNLSHTRSHSVLFGSKAREGQERVVSGDKDVESDRRQIIMVEQTFDIREEWEEAGSKEAKIYNRTRELFEGSSEEDLVRGGRRNSVVSVGMAR